MVKLIKENRVFLLPYFLILVIILPFLLIYTKAEIHLFLNQFHTPIFDIAWKYITYLGDGLIIVIIGVLALLVSIRGSIFIVMSYLVSGLFAQILKRLLFPDVARPVKYFEGISDLHLIEGVKLYSYKSFPSGHATTAFAFFFILSMMVKNKLLKFLFLILAILVAYSRVYLSQHFVIDIIAGSFLGIIVSFLLYYWINPSLSKKNWMDQSIVTFFKSRS